MTPYARLSGSSGVTAYELAPGKIRVKFVDGHVYTYSYTSAGREHVENMKLLARHGQGLSTYISQYVRDGYESKT